MIKTGKEKKEVDILICRISFFRIVFGVCLFFFLAGNLIALSSYFLPVKTDNLLVDPFYVSSLQSQTAKTQSTSPNALNSEQAALLNGAQVSPISAGDSGTIPLAQSLSLADGSVLVLGSFAFTDYNFDSNKTDLYFDNLTTAAMFPPDYSWQVIAKPISPDIENYFNTINFNNFEGPYRDSRCIKSDCLNQEGNDLNFNGLALNIPPEVQGLDIRAVSISALNKIWLVGYTIKDNNSYRGEVFYFNGQTFTKIVTPEEIISPYFGLFGFGGNENDFLIIYGAYNGIAYHVEGGNMSNISKFFSMRMMAGGFKAEVIRTAYLDNINWYIYSSTLSRPHFLKLWQNRGTEIVGVTAFDRLLNGGPESVALLSTSAEIDKVTLEARVKTRSGYVWATFTDRGFNNASEGIVTTIPLAHDGLSSKIIIKKIANSYLDLDNSSRPFVNFLFSIDGQNWQGIPLGRDLDFVAPETTFYFLKLIFSPYQDKFYSPFLDSAFFDYYAQKV